MCDKNNGDSPVVDVAARFILAHCTGDKDWLQEEILFTHNSFYLRCFFDLYLHTTGHYYNFPHIFSVAERKLWYPQTKWPKFSF